MVTLPRLAVGVNLCVMGVPLIHFSRILGESSTWAPSSSFFIRDPDAMRGI